MSRCYRLSRPIRMMLAWYVKRQLTRFERTWDYDVSYMRQILKDGGVRPLRALDALTKIATYSTGVPRATYHAAKITAAIQADCGPCAQLMVRMAERRGLDERTLAALVRGTLDTLPPEVRLGAEFARATMARDASGVAVREEIVRRWGRRALIPVAYGILSANAYPILKYALGYGDACRRIQVGGREIVTREVTLA